MKIAFLFGQLGLQYIYILFLLHPLTSVNTGRCMYKRPRKFGVPAAFHNFFLFSLKIPSTLHHIFSIAFYRKGRLYVQKTNNASFSIDKYESDYSDISLLKTNQLHFFQTLNRI